MKYFCIKNLFSLARHTLQFSEKLSFGFHVTVSYNHRTEMTSIIIPLSYYIMGFVLNLLTGIYYVFDYILSYSDTPLFLKNKKGHSEIKGSLLSLG